MWVRVCLVIFILHAVSPQTCPFQVEKFPLELLPSYLFFKMSSAYCTLFTITVLNFKNISLIYPAEREYRFSSIPSPDMSIPTKGMYRLISTSKTKDNEEAEHINKDKSYRIKSFRIKDHISKSPLILTSDTFSPISSIHM